MRIFNNSRLLQSLQLQLILAILVKLFLFSTSYAASIGNVQVTHCTTGNDSCGKVLVGAARIDFDAIQWVGTDSPGNLSLTTTSINEFGFTGRSNYLMTGGNENEWKYEATYSVAISQPQPSGLAPAMNHFFAPNQVGPRGVSHAYTILLPSDSESVAVEGEGVEDGDNPAILLNVDVDVSGKPCSENICNVSLSKGVTFTVTPKLNPDWQNLEGVETIEYALIELLVTENNTKCTRNKLSFIENGKHENSFAKGNYYHYLNGTGPDSIPSICARDYSFLVSIDKPFHIDATNRRDTQGGNVQYDFYVRGHKDAKYAGESWKSIRLNAYTTLPVANFNPILTKEIHVGQAVQLDGSGSKASTLGPATINKYQWNYQGDNGDNGGSSEGNSLTFKNPGKYTVSLTVTDNLGRTSPPSAPQTITVWSKPVASFTSIPSLEGADFTTAPYAAPLTLHLTSTSEADNGHTITGYEWQSSDVQPLQGNNPSITFANAGTYTISLTVKDDKGGVSDKNEQRVTVWSAPVASFTPTLIPGERVTLDGSRSKPSSDATSILTYEWKDNGTIICQNLPSCDASCGKSSEVSEHSITLTVTDDKGRRAASTLLDYDNCQSAQIEIVSPLDLNSLTFPTAYSKAHFVGGVSIGKDSGNFLDTHKLTVPKDFMSSMSIDVVTFKANITVPLEHVNQPADILVLVNYTPYDEIPSLSPWYMLEENSPSSSLISYPFFGKTWNSKEPGKPPNKELSKVLPIRFLPVEKLPQIQEVEIFRDHLPYMVGTYDIYVGYRLTEKDQIIFGPKPIHFEIQ